MTTTGPNYDLYFESAAIVMRTYIIIVIVDLMVTNVVITKYQIIVANSLSFDSMITMYQTIVAINLSSNFVIIMVIDRNIPSTTRCPHDCIVKYYLILNCFAGSIFYYLRHNVDLVDLGGE